MKTFPLSPFLLSLRNDDIRVGVREYERICLVLQTGGEWTITRLRDVLLALLVKNTDQEEVFLRRFHAFFPRGKDAQLTDAEIGRVLENLRNLDFSGSANVPQPRPVLSAPGPEPEKKHKWQITVLLSILLILIGFGIWNFWPEKQAESLPKPSPPGPVTDSGSPTVTIEIPEPAPERKRLYANISQVKIRQVPVIQQKDWQIYASISLCFLLILSCYGYHLWRSRKIPEDKPAVWDKGKDRPRHFSLGSLGGKRSPILTDDLLDRLADSMGYFQSEQASHIVDIPTSVSATINQGGVPALQYFRRKKVRTLLILEDTFAEASLWNTVPEELAEGMQQRGVPVLHGQFSGLPRTFRTKDGSVYHLEDLEDRCQSYLLMIFTDGKGLQGHENRFVLESLCRWPMVAWMELREMRFWDESTSLPVRHGIPVYPASSCGLMQVAKEFLTEQGSGTVLPGKTAAQQRLSEMPAAIDAQVEHLLGDALLWAQECALIQPVISPGLADALRRHFHPKLPPERIGRLYALSDTSPTTAGLLFSKKVRDELRKGFRNRRTDSEQNTVISFLNKKIEEARPRQDSDKDPSLQCLKWEAEKGLFHLQADPNYEAKRLAELSLTPLGPLISERVKDVSDHILTKNPKVRQRLARLKGNPLNIPMIKAFPLSLAQWWILGMFIVCFLGFSVLTIRTYMNTFNLEIQGADHVFTQIEIQEGDETWIPETTWDSDLSKLRLPEEQNYRIILYDKGCRSEESFRIEKNQRTQIIVSGVRDIESLCHEDFPDIGLSVQRCPDAVEKSGALEPLSLRSWKEALGRKTPKARLMSIGLEFSDGTEDPQLRELRNLLLKTRSVDMLYRVQSGGDDKGQIEKAFQRIRNDLAPWMGHSQLIWWREDPNTEISLSRDALPFERSLNIDNGADRTWITKLKKVFDPEIYVMVTEQEILQALGRDQTEVNENSIALVRPFKKLRSKPLTVSESEFRTVFGLDENQRPLKYIENEFEDNGDGTITDQITGLMWQKSGSGNWLAYGEALAYVEKLNEDRFAGYDDWRLPTIEELMSLLEPKKQSTGLYINPIFDERQRWCWSSDRRLSGGAWLVYFNGGDVSWVGSSGSNYVRVVRS